MKAIKDARERIKDKLEKVKKKKQLGNKGPVKPS